MKNNRKWPTAVDLYSGCGAVTEALKRRHFRVVAAVDNDPVACKTYRKNHPSVRLYEKDIRRVSPSTIRSELLKGKNLDLMVVCAPCQPFSSQGERNGADGRARLILSAVRFAEVLKPRLILFENVPGLATPRFMTILDELRRRLGKLGYEVGNPEMADAADYGVPQRRQRCILLAKRAACPPRLPLPTTPSGKRKSVRSAIGALPSLWTSAPGSLNTSRTEFISYAAMTRESGEYANSRLRLHPEDARNDLVGVIAKGLSANQRRHRTRTPSPAPQ